MTVCPYCGKAVELVRRDSSSSRQLAAILESTAQFGWPDIDDSSIVDLDPGWAEYERRQAGRAPTVEGDVRVPLAQSVIGGIMTGILAVPPVVIFEWPWQVPLVVSMVVSAVSWFAFIGEHRNMLWRVEKVLNRDFDGDGHKGNPVEHRTVIEGRIDDGHNVRDLILYFDDVPPEKIDLLFEAALGGVSLSEPAWCGKGKPFSKQEFMDVRDRMIEAGLWAWVNPEAHAQGVQVLANGRVLMSRWRDEFARKRSHARDVV